MGILEKVIDSDGWKWVFDIKKPELLTDKKYYGITDLPWYYSIPPFFGIMSRDVMLDSHQVPNRNYMDNINSRFMEPIFATAITDLSYVVNSFRTNRCTKLEVDALECYEYYGMRQGVEICKDYYGDYLECTQGMLQSKRIQAIRRQMTKRYVEYLAGKREWKDVYKLHPKPYCYFEPNRDNDALFKKNA